MLLVAALGVGLWVGDYGGEAKSYMEAKAPLARALSNPSTPAAEQDRAYSQLKLLSEEFQVIQGRQRIHFLLGMLACLAAVLVNSIAVTYFVGTTKWIREVVEAYSLSVSFVERTNRIKRSSFPWAICSMLMIVAIAALGGMSDPGGWMRSQSAFYVTPHFLFAMLGTAIIGYSFFVQVGNISANSAVIAEVMGEVRAARLARGLEVEPLPGEERDSPSHAAGATADPQPARGAKLRKSR